VTSSFSVQSQRLRSARGRGLQSSCRVPRARRAGDGAQPRGGAAAARGGGR
jgi:hypothetical protein